MRHKHKLSAQKLEELRLELEELKTKGRQELTNRLESVKNDIVEELENPFLDINEDRFFLEKQITDLEEIIKNSVIAKADNDNGKVEVGSCVRVAFESYEEEYCIVDPLEADPLNRKIASDSPVGAALLGARVGDTLSVDIAGIKKTFRVLRIN